MCCFFLFTGLVGGIFLFPVKFQLIRGNTDGYGLAVLSKNTNCTKLHNHKLPLKLNDMKYKVIIGDCLKANVASVTVYAQQ